MLSVADLKSTAVDRLADASALHRARRYDGAIYLCGYAVELALKAKICSTLRWKGFPSSSKEFESYRSFRTHSLDVLLHLCGKEATIKRKRLAQWSAVAAWDPSARYRPTGAVTKADATLMIESTKLLLADLI